ncbi:MAG: phytoene/squalene synthase family protein [Pseudomonadota bacterium]
MSVGLEAGALENLRSFLRKEDRDRYLAALLLNETSAHSITVLYAYHAELARIPDLIKEPMAGEIRLQWWRDVINSDNPETGAGHPVAATLGTVMDHHNLAESSLDMMAAGRIHDLYHDPFSDMHAFETYAGETLSQLYLNSARILGADQNSALADAAGHAGVATAIMEKARRFHRDIAQGKINLPLDVVGAAGLDASALEDGEVSPAFRAAWSTFLDQADAHLKKARTAIQSLKGEVKAAFRPLALVAPYCRIMSRAQYDPYREAPRISQLKAQWVLWRGL